MPSFSNVYQLYKMKTQLKKNKSKNSEDWPTRRKKENIPKEGFGFRKNLVALSMIAKTGILQRLL